MVSVGPGAPPAADTVPPGDPPTPHRGRRRRRGRRRSGRPLHRAGRGRAAARASCSCRARRSPSRRATGRRAGWRRRSTPTTASDLHLDRHGRRGARRHRPAQAEILCAEAPDRVHELERRGIRFDRSPDGELLLSLEGGHTRRRVVHAGGSATGRHVTARLSELVTAEERIEVHERSIRPRTVGRGRPLRRRRHRVGGDPARPQPCSPPAARRRCGSGRPTHAGRSAPAWRSRTTPAPRSPTWSSCSSTRPPSRCRGDLDGFLVTEAVRGEGALLVSDEGERFVDELAPRDEVARAMQSLMSAGRQRRSSTCAPVDMRAFPNIVERLGAAGIDPDAGPRAGRPRRALHDRRRGDRRARPLDACAACTRSASARAPACTARTGSPRTRSRSASSSVAARRCAPSRSRSRPRRPAAAPRSRRPARARARVRPSGATPGPCETPPGSSG